MSGPVVRKTVKHVDTTYIEAGRKAETPVKLVAMAAVIDNPWAGQGYVEDLRSNILKPGAAAGRGAGTTIAG